MKQSRQISDPPSSEFLGKALKTTRSFHQYSQRKMARELGVSHSFVSEIESGKRPATLKMVNKYAAIFDVESHEILVLAHAYSKSKFTKGFTSKFLSIVEWIGSTSENVDEDMRL